MGWSGAEAVWGGVGSERVGRGGAEAGWDGVGAARLRDEDGRWRCPGESDGDPSCAL